MKIRLLLVVLGVAYAVVYFFGYGHLDEMTIVSDFLFSLTAFIPVVAGFFVVRRYGLQGKLALALAALWIGFIMYFLGETTWLVLEVFLKIEIPYPSVADVFYLAAYPFQIYAFATYLRLFLTPLNRFKIYVVVSTIIVAILLSFLPLLQPLAVSDEVILTKSLDIAYPALDILLISLGVTQVMLFLRSKMGQTWVLISSGIILISISDVLFSYAAMTNSYFGGHPLDLPWLWGYLAVTAGLLTHKEVL